MKDHQLFLSFLKIFGLVPKQGQLSYFYSVFLMVLCIINILKLDLFVRINVASITELSNYAAGFLLRLINLVVLASSLLNSRTQDSILFELDQIDSQLKLGFSAKSQDLSIKKEFYAKIIAVFIVFFCMMSVLGFVWPDGVLDFWLRVVIARICNNTRLLQIIFYVEQLKVRLKCVNKIMNEIDANDRQLVLKLTIIKNVYSKLYKVLNLINECFSVELVFMFSQCVFALVVNTFWIFLSLSSFQVISYQVGQSFSVNLGREITIIILEKLRHYINVSFRTCPKYSFIHICDDLAV